MRHPVNICFANYTYIFTALLIGGDIYPIRYGFRFKIFDCFVSCRDETTKNSELL